MQTASRARTQDRGPPVAPGGTAPIHTTEKISDNRERLPNGNLLCRNVPVARVGVLIYGPGEVPVKPGTNGVSYVERTADTLFDARTIGSIMGAAVTIDHPTVDVDPSNWRQLSCGYALNVRRGEGADEDVILADLMVTDRRTIDAIEQGLVEVSLGYDADYLDVGGGLGKQFNILGNHIALVRKGRCGPRCAIGDSAFQSPQPATQKERQMATQRAKIRGVRRTLDHDTLVEAARQRFADAQSELEELEAAGGEDADTDTHIHVHTGDGAPTRDAAMVALDERVTGIEGNVSEILTLLKAKVGDGAPPTETDEEKTAREAKEAKEKGKTGDAEFDEPDNTEEGKTRDSAALATSYTQMLAQAEILVPGFKVPTFDATYSRAKTVDRMCATRRKVLDTAYGTPEGKLLIEGVNGGQPFDCIGIDCVATATLFKAAAAAKATANNTTATRDSQRVPTPVPAGPVNKTIAEINAANKAFWESQAKAPK